MLDYSELLDTALGNLDFLCGRVWSDKLALTTDTS